MNIKYFLFFLTAFIPAIAIAQVGVEVFAGAGTSYAKATNLPSKYLPVTRPHGGINLHVPIHKRVALRAGLMYSIRGYNSVLKEQYGKDKQYYTSNYRMHYISAPLMLSVNTMKHKNLLLHLDAGMQYNFFAGGSMRYDYKHYKNNELADAEGISYRIVGRMGPSKYTETQNSYDVSALDVAMKMQLRIVVKDKYTLSVFHENSLYDIRVKPDNPGSSVKMRNTGMSIGYIIR